MYEEIRYPVCPYRNVPAAYQRFLGPDSGGIERFFPGELAQRVDGTLLIVRVRSKKAVTGASQVVGECANEVIRLIGRVATLLFGSRPMRAGA